MKTELRAIVNATRTNTDFKNNQCSPLCDLIDRPFLQHLIEGLAEAGFRKIEFLLNERFEEIKELVGDGKRWGIEVQFNLVRDAIRPYYRLKGKANSEPFLFVDASRMIDFDQAAKLRSDKNVFFFSTEENADTESSDPTFQRWTGTAWLHADGADALAQQVTYEVLESELNRCCIESKPNLVTLPSSRFDVAEVNEVLKCDTFEHLLNTQELVFGGSLGLIKKLPPKKDSLWIGRNVYIHPSLNVKGPVFIGPNCHIDQDVNIGPNVVISSGCYISPNCEVQNSFLMADSMLGEGLDVIRCAFDRNQMLHIAHNIALDTPDESIFGSTAIGISEKYLIRNPLSRFFALVIFLVTLPALIVMMIRCRSSEGVWIATEKNIQLPIRNNQEPKTFRRYRFPGFWSPGDANFSHFLSEFIPGLINVLRGEMQIVGVSPITPRELKKIPDIWRDKHTKCYTGIISESVVMYGGQGTEIERSAAEVYFAVSNRSRLYRIKRLLYYFGSLFCGPRVRENLQRSLTSRYAKAMFHNKS